MLKETQKTVSVAEPEKGEVWEGFGAKIVLAEHFEFVSSDVFSVWQYKPEGDPRPWMTRPGAYIKPDIYFISQDVLVSKFRYVPPVDPLEQERKESLGGEENE